MTKEEKRNLNKISQKKWYKQNKNKALEYLRVRRVERRKWFAEILNKLSCIECGENHPSALDFHHRDPNTKFNAISKMLGDLRSKDSILKEIEKRDVLCANCHRKLHYKER